MNRNVLDYPDVPEVFLEYTDRFPSWNDMPKNNPSIIFRITASDREKKMFFVSDGLNRIYYTKKEKIEEILLKYAEVYQNNPIVNLKELISDVIESDFKLTDIYQIVNVIYKERTTKANKKKTFEEMKCLFLTSVNKSIFEKKNLLKLLLTGYSSVKNKDNSVPAPKFAESDMSIGNELTEYVLDFLFPEKYNNYIPDLNEETKGATFWDGMDFLAWGLEKKLWKEDTKVFELKPSEYYDEKFITILPQAKFRDYHSIVIPEQVYDEYKKNIPTSLRFPREQRGKPDKEQEKIMAVVSDTYRTPAAVFDKSNWKTNKTGEQFFVFIQDKEFIKKYGLKREGSGSLVATAAVNGSIFWKRVKNNLINEFKE